MIDDSIEYRSIIMRCDQIEKTAYRNLSSDMEIEFFKEGMETVWADVQKRAGEYYGAAEPPVRCGESHLSGLTEPLRSL